MITKKISIEELLDVKPESVGYLLEKGIACLVCGEPIWGTLEEAAKLKGYDETAIDKFISELNALM